MYLCALGDKWDVSHSFIRFLRIKQILKKLKDLNLVPQDNQARVMAFIE